jgi:hypothetical protein
MLIVYGGDEAGVVKAVAGAGIDGVAVGVCGELSEACFFEKDGPWVAGADVVEGCQDATN